jgi:hypothetical protein
MNAVGKPKQIKVSAQLEPRGLPRAEAAAYVGLSPSAFSAARREGKYPNPTLPGGRYDRRLLDEVMNRLSGIGSNSSGSI